MFKFKKRKLKTYLVESICTDMIHVGLKGNPVVYVKAYSTAHMLKKLDKMCPVDPTMFLVFEEVFDV